MTKRAFGGHTPYCPPVPGLPADYSLTSGAAVMVPVGVIAAEANGQPAVICYATVLHPAGDRDREIYEGDPGEVLWLDVHAGGGAVLPQMYRRAEILGVPALGLNPG